MDEFLMPMLENEQNTDKWPNVVCNDIAAHAESVQAQASVVSGQMTGKTHLPLPHGAQSMSQNDDLTSGSVPPQRLRCIHSAAVGPTQCSHNATPPPPFPPPTHTHIQTNTHKARFLALVPCSKLSASFVRL
jgi:hypothetical protein